MGGKLSMGIRPDGIHSNIKLGIAQQKHEQEKLFSTYLGGDVIKNKQKNLFIFY